MKRFSPSGQHYPDPSKPPDGEGGEEQTFNEGSKRVKTSQSFESLFDNDTLSDVIINVSDGQFVFQAHKMILGMKSDTLAAMLNELPAVPENEKPVLFLQESPECSQVFSRFLYFIYSGAVWLHRDYVIPLHNLAEKYAVRPLVSHCESYITQILHNTLAVTDYPRGLPVDTVCAMCESYSFTEEIRNISFRVLCSRFKDLVRCDRWPLCNWHLLRDLLRNDECQGEENLILTSATDWMKKNNLNDKAKIQDILTNIRYPLLNRRVLYHLQKNGAFKNFPQVHELVQNAIKYHCFKDLPEAKDEFVGIQYQPRKGQQAIINRASNITTESRTNSSERLPDMSYQTASVTIRNGNVPNDTASG